MPRAMMQRWRATVVYTYFVTKTFDVLANTFDVRLLFGIIQSSNNCIRLEYIDLKYAPNFMLMSPCWSTLQTIKKNDTSTTSCLCVFARVRQLGRQYDRLVTVHGWLNQLLMSPALLHARRHFSVLNPTVVNMNRWSLHDLLFMSSANTRIYIF